MYAHEIILKEAKERGFQKGLEIVAIKLWQNNFPPSMISGTLGLSIERIEFLISELESKTLEINGISLNLE
jgi:hypothetical protein